MRRESTVQHKLQQVLYRHLQRRLRENFKQKPSSCRYNRSFGSGVPVGVCVLCRGDSGPRGVTCDERSGGNAQAEACPWFEPRQTKDEIRAEFKAVFSQPDRGLTAAAFPDVAALLWVLDPEEEQPVMEGATTDALAQADQPEDTLALFAGEPSDEVGKA